MSVFQTFLNIGKINKYRKSFKFTSSVCKCVSVRNFSDVSKKFVSFDQIAEQRRAQAKRSLVVQVNSEKSFSELHGYCSKYASIKGMHHYKNSAEEHFILIEFSTEENLKVVIRNCSSHQKNPDVMAINSPFLWFRAAPDKKHKYPIPPGVSLSVEDGEMMVNDDILYESLMNCSSVSEQIQMLYDRTALNDLGVRLRYIVARQIESLLEGMYSNVAVRPFGSTVNGFGKIGCDLDLVLTNIVTDEMSSPERRLVFQEKRGGAGGAGGRGGAGRQLELAASALELRAPGAARVLRVPAARVPIVQCTQHYAQLEVDLCCNNMSGVYMSELLWLLGELDPRVRPLVFAVRRWAQAVGLTNPSPGRWITNFPLTLMVLFFLQQPRDTRLLPPVADLKRAAGKEDIRTAEDGLDCTFVRSRPPPKGAGSREGGSCPAPAAPALEPCLLNFFEFYAQFDFQEKAISLVEGVPIRKPNSQPLFICNPLEPTLNVSKNVSHDECERLKAEVRNAAWQLEGGAGAVAGAGGGAGGEWGALLLLERGAARGLRRLLRAGGAQRLVSVEDLFKEDDPEKAPGNKQQRLTPKNDKNIEMTVREMKSQIDGAKHKNNSTTFKFKNSQTASEVYRIRRNKIV